MKTCIQCGRELPEEANFCPDCGTIQTEAEPVPELRPRRKKTITAVIIAVIAVLALVLAKLVHIPRTYDAGGAVYQYCGEEGNYTLLLSFSYRTNAPREPMEELTARLQMGEEYLAPSILFALDAETGEAVPEKFSGLIRTVEVQTEVLHGGEQMRSYGPERNEQFPEALMMADIQYTANSGSANDIVWTITMQNGDRILLRHRLTVERLEERVYTTHDAPMGNIEELRALLERIQEEDIDSLVTVYLPAVTYEGGFALPERGVEFVGTKESDRQTTFTGELFFGSRELQIPTLRNIVVEGGGTGTGIRSSGGMSLYGCTVRGWETGILAEDGAWVGIHESLVEDNATGFRFDSQHASLADMEYDRNRFTNNETAVSLIRVPGMLTLSFPLTVFYGNGEDVVNEAGYDVDLSNAVFR